MAGVPWHATDDRRLPVIYFFQTDISPSSNLSFVRIDTKEPLERHGKMVLCPITNRLSCPIVFDDTHGVPVLVNSAPWWRYVTSNRYKIDLPPTFVDEQGRIRDKDLRIIMDVDQPKT